MIPLILLSLGCGVGKTAGERYFGDFACEYEPWEWYGDPLQSVLQADEGGAFNYDPPGELVTGRSGFYDFDSGDFAWENAYLPGYYGVSGRVEGYGTVFDTGDLDLLYRTVFADVLGEESHGRVRTERQGCTETMSSWAIEPGADLDTTPAEDPFTWTLTIVSDDRVEALAEVEGDGTRVDYERVWTSDLKTETRFSAQDGSYLGQTVMSDDGTGSGTQEVYGDEIDAFYAIDFYLDGGRRIVVEGYLAGTNDLYQECDYTTSYAGEGSGTCSYYTESGDFDCVIEFDESSCVLDCGSGGTYDC